jgi:cytochrome c556
LKVTHLFICGGIVSLMVLACSSSPAPPNNKADSGERVGDAVSAQLWGDMRPVVSVKELMRDLIDPIADNIFNAVSTVVTLQGTVETAPKTEEDWDKVRIGAVTMAEAAYLLKVRRPFAPAGELNDSVGPDAVELSPDQITAKVDKDPVEWNARIEALRNVGLQVLDIVKRRDVAELWDAAENLDIACESCHRSYWYPGETPEFYRKLDSELGRRLGNRPDTEQR